MRLIDANVLVESLTAMKSAYDAITLDGIIKALKDAPTIEAVPVVHGKWEYVGSSGMNEVYQCNQCGTRRTESLKSPFCPGCGANMVRRAV